MKIDLVMPRKNPGKLADFGVSIPPIAFGILAALAPDDAEIRIIDENERDIEYDSADLVGVSVMTQVAGRAADISREYKRRGATVVWGGIHPTVVDVTGEPYIDSVVMGEAESVWPRLIDDFKRGELRSRYRGEHGDLDAAPLPLRFPRAGRSLEPILLSRGCPWKCDFCSAQEVYGNIVRRMSVDRVEQEVRSMQGDAGFLADDNIVGDRRYAKEVLPVIGRYEKRWFAQADPQASLDEGLVMLMADAGIRAVLIGFETVNPENMKRGKYVPPECWGDVVENYHRHGIAVDGCFIIGFDHDGPDVFERTQAAVKASGMDLASYAILTPYPGTPLYDQMRDRLLTRDWDVYDLNHVVFEPAQMSPQELHAGVMDMRKDRTPSAVWVQQYVFN